MASATDPSESFSRMTNHDITHRHSDRAVNHPGARQLFGAKLESCVPVDMCQFLWSGYTVAALSEELGCITTPFALHQTM
jgi:hypothetical protein